MRDPEGLTRVDGGGETVLVVASSLCVLGANGSGRQQVCDGLVRVRYTPHGDLQAQAMPGFRDWLLRQVPSIAEAAQREPDAGGLNIEGLAWDPRARTLLFGLRGPADRGIVTVIRVPIDAGAAPWTVEALGRAVDRARSPTAIEGEAGHPRHLIRRADRRHSDVVGRSISTADEPFQLCAWDGSSDTVDLLDVKFRRSMKPKASSPTPAPTKGDSSSSTTEAATQSSATRNAISRSTGWNRAVPGARVAYRWA